MSENYRDRSGGSSRSGSRRNSGRGSSGRRSGTGSSGYRPNGSNSLLIIILSVVVVISVIAGAFVSLHRRSSGTAASAGETAESSIQVVVSENKLELNKYPAVNELIANYRKAFQDGDTALLKKVYNTTDDISQSILTGTSSVIEGYKNTQYYTKKGLKDGEYVAYVYDELKLADIDTLAPNLSVFYIKTADDGSLYIYRGTYNSATGTYEYDKETQNYIDSLYQDEDVMNLISTVNTKMDSACANDADLMSFMEKLRSQTDGSITSSTETGTASETSVETSAETGSAAETSADTASAAEETN